MCSGRQMNRLLQGDVGSGKTAVAMCATYKAVKSGYQAAVMVPTAILAKQHYENILDLSKIEAGKVEINNADYEVETLFNDVINMMRIPIEKKGLKFNVSIDKNISPVSVAK